MPKRAFNAKFLDNPPRPANGAVLYFDQKATSLALRVPASGDAVYYVIARDQEGRERRVRIGHWSPHGGLLLDGQKADIDQLRDLAKVVRANLKAGRQALSEPGKQEPSGPTTTLRQALNMHIAGRKLAPGTVGFYNECVDRYLKDWLNKPLASITREDAYNRHRKIGEENGRGVADGAFRTFRAAWNRARRQSPELGECPSINVDWFHLPPRDYGVRGEHLPVIYANIMAIEDEILRDWWLTILYSGLRFGSALGIRVEDVDFANKTLRITTAKGGHTYAIPLTRQLTSVLKRRVAYAKDKGSVWVFPGTSSNGQYAKPRVSALPPPHALRKAFASIAALIAPSYTLKRLLGHAIHASDISEHYIFMSASDMLPAAQAIADRIDAIASGPKAKAKKVKAVKEKPVEVMAEAAE